MFCSGQYQQKGSNNTSLDFKLLRAPRRASWSTGLSLKVKDFESAMTFSLSSVVSTRVCNSSVVAILVRFKQKKKS